MRTSVVLSQLRLHAQSLHPSLHNVYVFFVSICFAVAVASTCAAAAAATAAAIIRALIAAAALIFHAGSYGGSSKQRLQAPVSGNDT
jgi:hypothetical protein